jgi:hypothetical protein
MEVNQGAWISFNAFYSESFATLQIKKIIISKISRIRKKDKFSLQRLSETGEYWGRNRPGASCYGAVVTGQKGVRSSK